MHAKTLIMLFATALLFLGFVGVWLYVRRHPVEVVSEHEEIVITAADYIPYSESNKYLVAADVASNFTDQSENGKTVYAAACSYSFSMECNYSLMNDVTREKNFDIDGVEAYDLETAESILLQLQNLCDRPGAEPWVCNPRIIAL